MRRLALALLTVVLCTMLSGCFWLLLGAGAGGGAVAYHHIDSDHWPCPECGATVSREFNVCPQCGAEVVPISEEEARRID